MGAPKKRERRKDMDPILKALQFAKAHAVATAVAVTTAGGASYVAWQNYNGAERTVDGGAYVKQDVAVKDKRGDLSLKMQGLKEAPKANEPAKADAKADGDDASKKLQDALKAAKEGDMKAETEEAAKAAQPTFEEAPKPEEPYIPEQATADETLDNVLDGNDSAAFKTANFASSGSGETTGSQSKGGKAAAKATGKSGAKAASGKKGSVAKTAKGDAKSGTAASGEATASGATETAKTGGDTGASDEKGSDGSEDKAGVETPGKTEEVSDNKKRTPTAEPMTKAPETGAPVNVEDTVSTEKREKVFENSDRNDARRMRGSQGSFDYEAAARKKREEEKRLRREECLADLKNAFEKECDCDVDDVAPTSNRMVGGITSNDVMQIAAQPDMKAKCVTLYADGSPSDLITLLKELGAKHKGERNSNLSFLLRNGTEFLDGSETIEGISLYPDKSGRVAVYFDNAPVAPSDKKKPDTGKASSATDSKTTTATTAATSETTGGAPKSSGDTTGGATTTSTRGGASASWILREVRRQPQQQQVARAQSRYPTG